MQPGQNQVDPDTRAKWLARLNEPIREVAKDKPKLRGRGWLIRLGYWWDSTFHERGLDIGADQPELEHFAPDNTIYEESSLALVRRILRREALSPDDVFIDLGCGKGRVLLQVAQKVAVKRVVGVDISSRLAQAAEANVRLRRKRLRCGDVQVTVADLRTWPIPDDATVVYDFHAVAGDTFDSVLQNVIASFDRNPRRLRLIYACPVLHHRVVRTGRFSIDATHTAWPSSFIARRASVYSVIPAAA